MTVQQLDIYTYPIFRWALPGNGEKGEDCGTFKTYRHDDHWFRVARYCGRFECPNCYEDSWLKREASHITERLNAVPVDKRKFRKAVHVIISPVMMASVPGKSEYRKMRTKAVRLLKESGMRGGSLIFHQKRMPNEDHDLKDSPHWHALGYGWIVNVDKIFKRTGWVIKNKGIRKSLYSTAFYQLSHASLGISELVGDGIQPMRQGTILTTTYFGVASYNQLKVEKFTGERVLHCPICDKDIPEVELTRITIIGSDPPGSSGYLSDIQYDIWIPAYLEALGY